MIIGKTRTNQPVQSSPELDDILSKATSKIIPLGTATLTSDGTIGSFIFTQEKAFDDKAYNLLVFTGGGTTIIFLSSPVIATSGGLKGVGNMVVLLDGTTNICKCKLTYSEEDNVKTIELNFVSNVEITASYEGYLYGVIL